MAAPQKQKRKIGNVTAAFMIGAAILFDALQFLVTFLHLIPAVGNAAAVALAWFITVLATATFGVWFALVGVNYFTGKGAGKRFLIVLSATVVELVPIIDAVPAITLGVVFLILQTRLEEGHIGPKDLVDAGTALTESRTAALRKTRELLQQREASGYANDNVPS